MLKAFLSLCHFSCLKKAESPAEACWLISCIFLSCRISAASSFNALNPDAQKAGIEVVGTSRIVYLRASSKGVSLALGPGYLSIFLRKSGRKYDFSCAQYLSTAALYSGEYGTFHTGTMLSSFISLVQDLWTEALSRNRYIFSSPQAPRTCFKKSTNLGPLKLNSSMANVSS